MLKKNFTRKNLSNKIYQNLGFSKNISSSIIDNFFNSESNALIIKYFILIKNILILLKSDQSKIDILKTKLSFKDTINFLNNLGKQYVTKNFKLENNENNINFQCHNIIKTIIILEIYKSNEKYV